jgi:CheY-like chemotaxis protein
MAVNHPDAATPLPAAIIDPQDSEHSVGLCQAEVHARILIIEDNRGSARALSKLLSLSGHDVAVAYTGPEGIAVAKEWASEVVISDVVLPGLDGFGVAMELRKAPVTANILLIALTGGGKDNDHHSARQAGFDHYLTKPVDPEVLLRLVSHFRPRCFCDCPICSSAGPSSSVLSRSFSCYAK